MFVGRPVLQLSAQSTLHWIVLVAKNGTVQDALRASWSFDRCLISVKSLNIKLMVWRILWPSCLLHGQTSGKFMLVTNFIMVNNFDLITSGCSNCLIPNHNKKSINKRERGKKLMHLWMCKSLPNRTIRQFEVGQEINLANIERII